MGFTRRRVRACRPPSIGLLNQWQRRFRKQVVITDLVSGLQDRLRGRVDVMVFNPPYVPSPPEEVSSTQSRVWSPWTLVDDPTRHCPQVGGSRLCAAWAGGYRGREVIDRLLPLARGSPASKSVVLPHLLTPWTAGAAAAQPRRCVLHGDRHFE